MFSLVTSIAKALYPYSKAVSAKRWVPAQSSKKCSCSSSRGCPKPHINTPFGMQVRCCNELYSPMKQCLKLFSFRLGAVEQDSQHSCNGTKLHGPRDSWKTKCCMSPSTLDPTQEWRSMALNICCPSTGTSCGGPEDPGKKWGYQIVVFVSPCDSGIPIWINTEPPHQ